MQDAGILRTSPGSWSPDRYQNYFHPRWQHIAGNQACLSHILRDYQDCAGSYPGGVWPVQAQRALRGMIRSWHAACERGLPAIPADALTPLEHEFRDAVLASVPRVPGPKNSTKQHPGRELLEFCRDCRDDVLRFTKDTGIWPTNKHQRARRPAPQYPAEDLRPPGQRRSHPGPPRHPRLRRYRPQARQERHGPPARPHARQAMATSGTGACRKLRSVPLVQSTGPIPAPCPAAGSPRCGPGRSLARHPKDPANCDPDPPAARDPSFRIPRQRHASGG